MSADYVNVEPLSSFPPDNPENVPLHIDDDVIEEYELTSCLVDDEASGPQFEARCCRYWMAIKSKVFQQKKKTL